MHNDGNVVPLHKATTDQAIHSPLARLPVVLLQVRDKAAQQLRQGLQALFDNADDTLFEMADRARNDVDQNVFFQAMRDLRLKRKSIERFFFEQFFDAFISLTQYNATHTLLPQPSSAEVYTTLARDELERNDAVEAMVNEVLKRDGFALDQLTARFSTLLGRSLMERHNPVGPTMLCGYFLQAWRNLGVEIKVKLIILKLFDSYVLSAIGQLYAEANQLLIATGVLADLQPTPACRIVEAGLTGTSVESDHLLERRRSEWFEQRTRDALESNAQTVLARRRVELELSQALIGKVLPRSVVLFVCEAWSKVLLLTYLKQGDQSTQWHVAVRTMEQLIWSVQLHEEPDARSRLLVLVPELLKGLREGLSGSAFDPFTASEFFTELEGLHVQLFEPEPRSAHAGSAMVEVLEEVVLPPPEDGSLRLHRGK
ncbi:DUF1631 family protein [Pseudomonas baetica]|uniref:DUF1631 family protein n=1 Tax=Pseudomonas baetica TaxID=674054 RepID=UPI003EEE48BD